MEIKVQGISKSFSKKCILNEVSFSAFSGQCIGILGENGSGKSTLFSILTGLNKGKGSFLCDGTDLIKNSAKRAELVGFVPQSPPLINELSGKDNLSLWYSKKDMNRELKTGVLKLLGIPEFYKKTVKKMSGGMKKRLSIGCAVAHNPKILFLDEPSSALDLICKEKISEYLLDFKSKGGIIIIATHDVYELQLCDKLYILKNGKLSPYVYSGDINELVRCLKK